MKQKSLLLFVLGILCSFNLGSQNLIQGGDMEATDRVFWTESGGGSFSDNKNTQLVWGDVANPDRPQDYKPEGFGTGGFLTVAEGWKGPVQYYIAQAVSLTADIPYTVSFDYNIGSNQKAYFEVYLGKTVPAVGSDYTDNKIGTNPIAWSDGWNAGSSGPFKVNYTPAESGAYYLVLKWGGGWAGSGGECYFNSSIDNVSLTKIINPVANFTVTSNTVVGMDVKFTNTSANAVSYLWDFGVEGATSTEANPTYTYNASGTYTVTLTVTGNGGDTHQKSMDIKICNVDIETILNGDMETSDAEGWNIVGAGTFASGGATWGATVEGFGKDGVLKIKEDNGTGTQYYIWKAVKLESGYMYDLSFDYAVTKSLKAWGEVFIGTVQPGDNDYSDGGSRGTKPIVWADSQNNTERKSTYNFSFTPSASGVYFYVIKFGTNGNGNFDVAIDNVMLNKITVEANFTASANKYWKNLDVTFTNTSFGADSYSWNFGDNSELSTDVNPTHKYTKEGAYTITLTAAKGEGTATKSMDILILGINEESIAGGDMEVADRNNWIEFGANNLAGGTNDQLVWGDLAGDRPQSYKPVGFETGGFLTACEDWAMSSMYKIAQAISLKSGVKYTITFDYAVGTHRRAYFEVFAGTSVPNAAAYSNNILGGSLIPYVEGWDGYGGNTVQKFNSEFTVENDGTYFFVIQLRGGDTAETYFNVSIDNVKLTVPTGMESINKQSITFTQEANEIQISEVVKSIQLISIQGQRLLNANNTNSVNISTLAKGVYVLQIMDNQGIRSVHKIIVH